MATTLNEFDGSVFSVPQPECPQCHNHSLNFVTYFNYQDQGTDWCVWYCESECGYSINIKLDL